MQLLYDGLALTSQIMMGFHSAHETISHSRLVIQRWMPQLADPVGESTAAGCLDRHDGENRNRTVVDGHAFILRGMARS